VALTAAERQQRRRDKIAALKPPPAPAAADRLTRQEAWDEACDTLQEMLEHYRVWLALTPAPAGSLRSLDLPRLAAQALTLGLVAFPPYFADDWHRPDDPPPSTAGTGLDPRSLREQLFAADPTPDPDRFPRTAAEDSRALAWWSRIPEDARSTWLRLARSADPLDVWYLFRDQLSRLDRG
jgi:hypothetical protein